MISSLPTTEPPSWLAELFARGQQVLAGLDNPGGHARLARLAPRTRVVVLLPADVTIYLQDAVVVGEHVPGDGPGERVLGVGVHVHLHHPVRDSLADLFERRPGTAVEDQVARLVLAVLGADGLLDLLQHRRAELHVAGLVDAVDVPERRRQNVPAAFAQTERLRGGERVFWRAVQLLVHRADDAVFLTADDADLKFHDDPGPGTPVEEILGDLEVFR